MHGRIGITAILVIAGLGVAGMVAVLLNRQTPLGVATEWEWTRLSHGVAPTFLGWMMGVAALAGYAAFCAIGHHVLAKRGDGRVARDVIAAVLLGVASIVVQVAMHEAAPPGYGLTKWSFAQHSPGSHGYYAVARTGDLADVRQFLARFPEWIQVQDALHIGTHPPGLFVLWRSVLDWMNGHPAEAERVVRWLPGSVKGGFREIEKYSELPLADRAAMGIMGALGLLASALTVWPLYVCVRWSGGAPRSAWLAASFWPLVPSAVLFQPATDVLYPVLATSAVALTARGRRADSVMAGVILALGMQLSLVFLAVGLLVGLVLVAANQHSMRERLGLVLLVGVGFVVMTLLVWVAMGANPLVIWYWNQRNHGRFYEQFVRSYWPWQLGNALDVAGGLGIVVVLWAIVGMFRDRRALVGWLTLAVLALLQISGRNLSEVARLWLPLFPPLVIAAGAGIESLGGGSKTLGVSLGLLGAQTLALQATIQVVYAAIE